MKRRNPAGTQVPPHPIRKAEQVEDERTKKARATSVLTVAPAAARPKDEVGADLGVNAACKCPNCRLRFNIGPFDREHPARPEDEYECPNPKCTERNERTVRKLFQFLFNVRRERDFFGQTVTCSNRIADPKDQTKRIRCGEVYRDKMPGPGAYDAQRDVGGMFRCCPRCGAFPRRAAQTATGRDMTDAEAPVIDNSAMAAEPANA